MEKAFRDFAFFPFINFSLRYRIIKWWAKPYVFN
jgi:hypothetical protein